MNVEQQQLWTQACKARVHAYAPYSNFAVGAALLGRNGQVYTGCNVENASYGVTNCAERTAFFKAISEGVRDFVAIAIAGGPVGEAPKATCPPCGVCRQVMAEFCDPETFQIFLEEGDAGVYLLKELLPLGFAL